MASFKKLHLFGAPIHRLWAWYKYWLDKSKRYIVEVYIDVYTSVYKIFKKCKNVEFTSKLSICAPWIKNNIITFEKEYEQLTMLMELTKHEQWTWYQAHPHL